MIVVPEMIGSIVGVYNGKTFNQVGLKLTPQSGYPGGPAGAFQCHLLSGDDKLVFCCRSRSSPTWWATTWQNSQSHTGQSSTASQALVQPTRRASYLSSRAVDMR